MNTKVIQPLLLYLKPDNWLTQQLGCEAWRIEEAVGGESLSLLESSLPIFAYAKVEASLLATVWRLNDLGFRVVDLALTFEGGIQSREVNANLRFAVPADRDAVVRIAAAAFQYSRFHLDPMISTETANAIKSEWANNYFTGQRGEGMVVAERAGQVVGFLQLFWQSDILVIDLIGVDPSYQGQGIGRELISYASCYGSGDHRKPQRMKVGTQAANISSVRLYEALGFRLTGAQYVLHYHSGGWVRDL
ncbi:MAG: GNAT family N-acetyltransferase [Gammaproteobacteria bacterium]|nr:GNAT family N-acetyltransferase [Gammaproteobacteria bacterium]